MTDRIMIVDGNALGHVVKHATKELSYRGSKTGVIYGFIQKLFKIQGEVQANGIIFTWDANKRYLYRCKFYPDYKLDKRDKPEKDKELDRIARPQFKTLRKEVLPRMGFQNQLIQKGLEADDIIAQCVKQYKDDEWVMVSRDNDLHQLLEADRVSMFDPVKFGYFTADAFEQKWGVPPSEWEFVKAIAGCAGDGVPGIPGVKEKTAIKFLKRELKATTQAHARILAGEKECLRNLRLVKLPWETTPYFDIGFDVPSLKGFADVCVEYGFRSFLDDAVLEDFRELFCTLKPIGTLW
jgi:5'-3' exonuclease